MSGSGNNEAPYSIGRPRSDEKPQDKTMYGQLQVILHIQPLFLRRTGSLQSHNLTKLCSMEYKSITQASVAIDGKELDYPLLHGVGGGGG